MKTITLLCVSAALVLALDNDVKKVDNDVKRTANSKTTGTAPVPAKPARRAASGVVEPAKRNLHQPTVTRAQVELTPEQKAAAALPTVPEGAEEVGPNLFRLTDPQGKRWMYRKTPFGVSKWEEKPGEQEPSAEFPSSPGATITDLGDSVQFQRMTPFGPQKWTRKKSELTDSEKAAIAIQEHAKQAATKPPEQQ
jgi:hypothetical protein